MLKLVVNGAKGRMGREVVAAVQAEADLQLVAETDIGDRLERAIRDTGARVVVDFTVPKSAVRNTEIILEAGACPVVGTTGFATEEIDRLQRRAQELGRGGLIAPNFAIGAVLLMKFAADAARYLPDVEIVEYHHDKKVDAPSGTALKTAELIQSSRSRRSSAADVGSSPVDAGAGPAPGARGGRYLDIPMHSVRLPGFVAHQEVLFGGPGQVLTLRHDATSRVAFMPGVILAVRKVPELNRLYYGLEHLLEL